MGEVIYDEVCAFLSEMSIGKCIWYRQEHGIGNSNSTTTKKDLGILNAEPKDKMRGPETPKNQTQVRPKSEMDAIQIHSEAHPTKRPSTPNPSIVSTL